MPFDIPSLATLISRSQADINARLVGADARLTKSNLNILSFVQSGGVQGLYRYLKYLSNQILPDTSESEFLERQADIWGITRLAAVAANGNITITGVNGATVPTGTAYQRADGVQFKTTADATISGGTATVNVVASVGSASSNTSAGITLSIVSPITNIDATATVATGGLSSGADIESDSSLRARLLDRIRTPPQGGAKADYIKWAKEVNGVTRAWASTPGPGLVTVYFVRDNDVTIIPDSGEVAAVQAYIDVKRPVTAVVTVLAPTAAPINFTIAVTPNTLAVKNAVQAELQDLILREAEPGATILLSHIRAAISQATGETDYVLTVPSANVTNSASQIATMGTITWV